MALILPPLSFLCYYLTVPHSVCCEKPPFGGVEYEITKKRINYQLILTCYKMESLSKAAWAVCDKTHPTYCLKVPAWSIIKFLHPFPCPHTPVNPSLVSRPRLSPSHNHLPSGIVSGLSETASLPWLFHDCLY